MRLNRCETGVSCTAVIDDEEENICVAQRMYILYPVSANLISEFLHAAHECMSCYKTVQ
jgi:hypothetical protein